jgi:hypothetical protein
MEEYEAAGADNSWLIRPDRSCCAVWLDILKIVANPRTTSLMQAGILNDDFTLAVEQVLAESFRSDQ